MPVQALPKVTWLATFLTWWTVLIEGVLAILFLLPLRGKPSWFRHALLAVFVATTYSVATVSVFAWVVVVLGLCATTNNERTFRVIYVGLLLLLQIFRIPFGDLITANL